MGRVLSNPQFFASTQPSFAPRNHGMPVSRITSENYQNMNPSGLDMNPPGESMRQPYQAPNFVPAPVFNRPSDNFGPVSSSSFGLDSSPFMQNGMEPFSGGSWSHSPTQRASPLNTTSSLPSVLNYDALPNEIGTEAPQHCMTYQSKLSEGNKMRWPCTSCDRTVSGKRGWKRHVKNQHFPDHKWTCQPDIVLVNKELFCRSCNKMNPDCGHVARIGAHACAKKVVSGRQFTSKDKFEEHLINQHGLSGNCLQTKLEAWKHPQPRRIWGCGYCIKGFDDIEDYLPHVERHYEGGSRKVDWDQSLVVQGLLTLPFIRKDWLDVERNFESQGQQWPEMSWSKEDAIDLQRLLTTSEKSGAELANRAFELSYFGKGLLPYQNGKLSCRL